MHTFEEEVEATVRELEQDYPEDALRRAVIRLLFVKADRDFHIHMHDYYKRKFHAACRTMETTQ